jgi:hypothetical protein
MCTVHVCISSLNISRMLRCCRSIYKSPLCSYCANPYVGGHMLCVRKQRIANIMVIPLVDSYIVRVTTHRVGLG